MEALQDYWWFLISLLGGLLVFLLFVQGGQSMILSVRGDDRNMIVNSMGHKWELTFTTLVVFGGAAFASFPLFYSTSFGGAYWLWMLILFSFVLQAVSYEYRRKKGNVYGTGTYDAFLFINGCVGCLLLGVAVGMFFFGGEFTVRRANLLDQGNPVISEWAPTHGLEAVFCWKNLVLGVAVLFLARTQSCLYMINNFPRNSRLGEAMRRLSLVNGGIFLVFFLAFLALLLTASGIRINPATGVPVVEDYIYLHNYLTLWWAGVALLAGVVAVLYGLARTVLNNTFRKGIWFTGIGTVLVVMSLFWVAGYNDTAFLPSLTDPASSLTIRNASSSAFTLRVMSWVSLIAPVVIAYIWYVWRRMNAEPMTVKEAEKGY